MSNDLLNPSLSNLTSSEMASATYITFKNAGPNDSGWDSKAEIYGTESNALLHSLYRFDATEGQTFDMFSISYFDPYALRIYDKNGHPVIGNSESNDPADFVLSDGVGYGVDFIENWISTYTGSYYVEASPHQGDFYTFHELMLGVENTAMDEIADKIFTWAESEYPALFLGHPQSEEIAGFHARIYADSQSALGERDGNLFFYDGLTETIALVGTVNDFPI